jgi:hypothetical protein
MHGGVGCDRHRRAGDSETIREEMYIDFHFHSRARWGKTLGVTSRHLRLRRRRQFPINPFRRKGSGENKKKKDATEQENAKRRGSLNPILLGTRTHTYTCTYRPPLRDPCERDARG